MQYFRKSGVTFAITLAATTAAFVPVASATSAPGSAIPRGTVLNVGDQFQQSETLFKVSGVEKDLPFKINFVEFIGGPALTAAFASNRIDIGGEGDAPVGLSIMQGLHLKAIAASVATGTTEYLIAAPGSGITSLAGLRGKTVAFDDGGGSQAFALRVLAKAGLKQQDIKQVNDADEYAALEGGDADAAAIIQVDQARKYLQQHPTAKVLATNLTVNPPFYNYEIATTKALADPAKKAAIQDFLKLLVKANNWKTAHEAEYATDYYVDVEHETQAQAKAAVRSSVTREVPITKALQAALQTVINLEATGGAIKHAYSVAPIFNSALAQQWNTIIGRSTNAT